MRIPPPLCIVSLLFLLGSVTSQAAPGAQWISSTDSARWVTNAPLTPAKAPAGEGATVLVIDPSATAQKIKGWGGCFNEIGWKALQSLPEAEREAVLKNLFDPVSGCRFNICRTPIGASDFALEWYSYDETADDYALEHFSIERDRHCLIPYIRAAMRFRPDLKVWGSPWSPPSWMKNNRSYTNRQIDDLENTIREEPKVLDAYAHYFARYVTEYRKEGIDLYAIHVQNEPASGGRTIYPSCNWWKPEPMRDFIKNHLGPVFQEQKIPAQIWLGTCNVPWLPWFKTILDDKTAAAFISGVGLQWDGAVTLGDVRRLWPTMPLMQTETECGRGKNCWADAEKTFSLIRKYLTAGCEAYMYWNMVLDETGKSAWGWRQNSPVVVDAVNKKVTYTPEFHIIKHLSAFVPPGAFLLKTSGANDNVLAFKNPDNSIIVCAMNQTDNATQLTIGLGDQTYTVPLAGHSMNTLLIPAK